MVERSIRRALATSSGVISSFVVGQRKSNEVWTAWFIQTESPPGGGDQLVVALKQLRGGAIPGQSAVQRASINLQGSCSGRDSTEPNLALRKFRRVILLQVRHHAETDIQFRINSKGGFILNRIFSDRLSHLMAVRDITQVQLAEGIGTNQSTISRYLKGQLPRADDLVKLAQFFGLRTDELLSTEALQERSKAAAKGLLADLSEEIGPQLDESVAALKQAADDCRRRSKRYADLAASYDQAAANLQAERDGLDTPP